MLKDSTERRLLACNPQVEDYFPLEAAPLGRLHTLALLNWGTVETFPATLTALLSSLAVLTITGTNMRKLPSAVADIPTLQELSLDGNLHLQLQPGDVTTLTALPNLRVLGLSKKPSVEPFLGIVDEDREHFARIFFSRESLEVLQTIRETLPLLELRGVEEVP